MIALLALQIMFGAFTAGLRAGYAFAEWPMMGGRLFPEGVPMLQPFWLNAVNQPVVVQFIHRWLAWIVAAAIVATAVCAWRRGARMQAIAIVTLVAIQIVLGISTLLSGVVRARCGGAPGDGGAAARRARRGRARPAAPPRVTALR